MFLPLSVTKANKELSHHARKLLHILDYKNAKNMIVEKDIRPILNFNWLDVEFLYHSREVIPYLVLQKLAKGHVERKKNMLKLKARHD